MSADSVDVLEEVAEFRRVARIIVRADLDVQAKCLALAKLGLRANEAAMPEWCRSAAWEEARECLVGEPASAEVPGDAVEVAARTLRAKGNIVCPTCARPLHGEADFARWRGIRRREIEELQRREAAVRS